MKRMLLLLLLVLWSCSNEKELNSNVPETSVKQSREVATVVQEKPSDEVIIHVPAPFVSVEMANDLELYTERLGVTSANIEEDGSVRLIMTKQKHKQLLNKMNDDILNKFEQLVKDNEVSSIRRIYYNDAFTEFDITVKLADYEKSFESFAVFNTMVDVAYFKIFEDNDMDELLINYIDVATGEIYDTEKLFEKETSN